MADTIETIKCPACGKDMEKVYIPSEGINIDICTNGCGGIFFDNREFDKFNEEYEDISVIIEKLKNNKFTPINDEKERTCPHCGGKMIKNKTAPEGGICVDDCYACGGKFLDYGELEKIRAEFSKDSERSQATIDYLMQKKGLELAHENMERINNRRRSFKNELIYILTGIDL